VIGVVLVLTAVGGLVARNIYQPPPSSAASPPTAAPPPTTTDSGAPTPVPPGPPDVQLSADAAAVPYGAAVQSLLQTYFNAINADNYALWETVVSEAFIAANPEKSWTNNYESSRDGSIYVYRIDAAPNSGLRVMLTFTSLQDVAKAPPFAPYPCINWHSVLPVIRQNGSWKVDSGSNGQHPPTVPCQT
jgi:hypothetical protein